MSTFQLSDQIMRKVCLFSSLDEQQLAQLKQGMRHYHLKEGDFLFQQGSDAHCFFIVLKGQMKLSRISAEGAEKVIEFILTGQSFAEAIMFMSRQIYPVNAQAIGDTELVSFENKVFLDILAHSFDTCLRVMCGMSMRLRGWLNEIDNLTLQNATYRLIGFLQQQLPENAQFPAEILLDIPKNVLASRLSVQPETLSRILKNLSLQGIISVEGKSIIINDINKLRI